MLYTNRIKKLAKEKKISIKKIANEIGMTDAGLHAAFRNNTLKVEDLLKISNILEVDIKDILSDEIDTIREDIPYYGMSDKEVLHEILKTVKNLEKHLLTSKK